MKSILITTPVEKLQDEIIGHLRTYSDRPGVYVSLNKTQKSTEEILIRNGIDVRKLFFIDCVTNEKTRDDVLHISPDKLDLLTTAIQAFVQDIKQPKYLIIDAISTLLIYNAENKVAQFVKSISELQSKDDLVVVAFSPETKGEELLNKIFNFFDTVEKK